MHLLKMLKTSEIKEPKMRVRFILSHPIQYFSPLFRELSKESDLDFEVWYCSDESVNENKDIGFGTTLKWDIPLLEGYNYRFFSNQARRPSIHFGFMGLWNPDLISAISKEPKNTVIILHGWNYITHLMVLLLSRVYHKKLILRGDNPDHHDRMMSPGKQWLKKLILLPLLKLPNLVFYAGKRNFLFFRMYGVSESKLCFSPHSVDNERFQLSDQEKTHKRNYLRRTYHIPDEAIVIISPAKYIPKKRLQDIIEAVGHLNNPHLYLMLAGEGPSRDFLQNKAKDTAPGKVIFTGFINQSEMPDHYAMADILCMASGLGETWGLGVNEGMNSGLPVILSDLCGCAEDLVEPGVNGYIFPTGNVMVLADYIRQLSEDSDLRTKMGAESKRIIQKYGIHETLRGMLNGIKCLTRNE